MIPAISDVPPIIPDSVLKKWQGIVDTIAEVIGVPYAMITRIAPPHIEIFRVNDANPQHFKAGDGWTMRSDYCQTVFNTHQKLLVPNAFKDETWVNNPEVQRGLISYLGFPILLPDGEVFGTICVLDTKENTYGRKAETLILLFKDQIETHLALLIHQADLEQLAEESAQELIRTNEQLVQEIKERKQAFLLLKESEDRFRSLVENSPIGKAICQREKIIYQNPEHRRILGPVPDRIGFPYIERIHAEDVERVKRIAGEFLEWKAHILNVVFRIYPFGVERKSKYLKWVQCRAIHINYENEDAVLAALVDITRSRELEHLVRIKDKMSALGRVATGIAHEILSPLSAINMNLSTLQEACLAAAVLDDDSVPTVNKISEKIQEASSRIETIIKKVSDFARPSPLQFSITDVNQCIEKAVDLSASMLRKIGIKLQCDLTRGLPNCRADHQMIEEVLLNLISNSAQALQNVNGARVISISSEDRQDAIVIRVADSGPGIPEEIRDMVFDPFFTTKTDGIGIGLALAHRIVADHGGDLNVGCSRWGGAEFTVTIPTTTGE